jgi:hypothetical protein
MNTPDADVIELYATEQGLFVIGTDVPVECQWFAHCSHQATHLCPHPVLGDVPCCDRCSTIGRT